MNSTLTFSPLQSSHTHPYHRPHHHTPFPLIITPSLTPILPFTQHSPSPRSHGVTLYRSHTTLSLIPFTLPLPVNSPCHQPINQTHCHYYYYRSSFLLYYKTSQYCHRPWYHTYYNINHSRFFFLSLSLPLVLHSSFYLFCFYSPHPSIITTYVTIPIVTPDIIHHQSSSSS